jgi:hypothetical protein
MCGFYVESSAPAYSWYDTDAAANNRVWDMSCYSNGSNETFNLRAVNDANSSAAVAVQFVRSGAGILNVNFPSGNVLISNNAQINGTLYSVGALSTDSTLTVGGAATVTVVATKRSGGSDTYTFSLASGGDVSEPMYADDYSSLVWTKSGSGSVTVEVI